MKAGVKVIEKNNLYLTNYRIVFAGPPNELFEMEIFIRDIVKIAKKRNVANTISNLFKISLRSMKEEKQEAYILSFERDEDVDKI